MSRLSWLVGGLTLSAVIALCFLRPSPMLSPGPLIPQHAALKANCLACHAPFQGASALKCISCHRVAEIGLVTTKAVSLKHNPKRPAFHSALTELNCMACHSDHPKPAVTKVASMKFDHSLIKTDRRANCQSCHTPPRDSLHNGENLPCAMCHRPSGWQPANFDHDRYFKLDGHHEAACTTCHIGGDYMRSTCYGCHAHQPAQIIALHRAEGITNLQNCVRCHRSGSGETGETDMRETGDD
jgi:hypothetical protein